MLGDRSMVGQCPLEALIQVRILIAQPDIRERIPEDQPKPTSLEVHGEWTQGR